MNNHVTLSNYKDDKYNVDFKYTMSQIKSSIFEQVSLIVLSLIILILIHSKVLTEIHVLYKDIFEALLASVFIASLYNLYDTANSIFIILKSENNN